MTEWVETASEEEQLKNYKHVLEVICECRKILNEIRELDSLATNGEVLGGFKL